MAAVWLLSGPPGGETWEAWEDTQSTLDWEPTCAQSLEFTDAHGMDSFEGPREQLLNRVGGCLPLGRGTEQQRNRGTEERRA